MDEIQKNEILAELGLMATQFATIEQLTHDLLVKVIVRDTFEIDDMFGITLIENQSLGKRIGLLEKLNRFDNDYMGRISDFIVLVKPKVRIRNYFIHGVWSIGETYIIIENKRITYREVSNGRQWSYGGAEHILPQELKQLNEDLTKIISKGEGILEDIENHGFNLN